MERNLNLSSLRAYLAFPFRDRDAVNRFLVGAALYIAGSIIPILPLIPALGYQYQVMRRVIEGEGPSMPGWDDWGRLFVDGLKLLLIGGVFMLPGLLSYIGGFVIYFISIFVMMGAGKNPDPGVIFGFLGGLGIMFVGIAVGMVLFLVGSFPLPIAASHAIARDQVSAAFAVKQWWPVLRRMLGEFLVVWVVLYGLAALLYFAYMLLYMSIVLCLVLPLVMGALSFYMLLVSSAMFASIYQQGAGSTDLSGEEVSPPPAPATPSGAPDLAPASAEMLAADIAAQARTETSVDEIPSEPHPARPGEEPDLSPASGEMIGVEVANVETPPAAPPAPSVSPASVAQAFAPELPSVPELPAPAGDPNATRLLNRAVLFNAITPEPDVPAAPEQDPNATRIINRSQLFAETFDSPPPPGASGDSTQAGENDPNRTRHLPPEGEDL